MAKNEIAEKVLDDMELFYLSSGVNPPREVADYSSDRPPKGTALKPGEVVTLPAPGGASPSA